ncbi:hypothetical protein [Williamsia sp. CHRR-6]|uniref:hypothetical protein n=1 Tax=Williamsia sp. CHRR-6 TaxID=2835871 RepID=UPI001BDA6FB2|nr:hypothetical protein [Williamsia sp. CHRR-6]MBT0566859.1 hypothetical protein [Williamsia sp. CHRR-6]
MDPIEINAGAWYLRALRADDRVSDVPALATMALGASPVEVIDAAAAGWAHERRFTWAACQPTTGELFALITVVASNDPPASAQLLVFTRPDVADSGAAAHAGAAAVVRFARSALELPMPEFTDVDFDTRLWNSSHRD